MLSATIEDLPACRACLCRLFLANRTRIRHHATHCRRRIRVRRVRAFATGFISGVCADLRAQDVMSQFIENSETQSCERCRQPTMRKCEECHLLYCHGCENQDHWNKCKNYEISNVEKFVFTAARDLLPGEIILEELPLVFGPKLPFVDGHVACVGCCRSISSENCSQCPECLWPACTPECEDLKNVASHGPECQILKLTGKNLRFEILLPLRILLLQKSNTKEWETLLQRIQTKSKITENIDAAGLTDNEDLECLEKLLLKLSGEENEEMIVLKNTSKELIRDVWNFSKNNIFNLSRDHNVKILYSASGIIQHSCVPNCFQSVDNRYKIITRASSKISKNSQITISYTDLFQASYDRRSNLKTSHNIICGCNRCQDPTEFGTFFSALKCLGTRTDPCTGTQLPVDPTAEQTLWICDTCDIELPNDQMVKFLQHLRIEVDKILSQDSTVEELEEFLAKLLMFLHHNHAYVCQVKLALVRKYTGEDLVVTKIQLCESLVLILKALCPAGGLLLARVLHELFEGKFLVLSGGCNDNEDKKSKDVREVEDLLNEMKRNVEGILDVEFRLVVAEDEEKFASWLNIQNT